jgi:phosphatidylserine decarboxylase
MAILLKDWIDTEVKELKKIPTEEFYGHTFHRDPLRCQFIDSSVLFSPCDGTILYQKEVGPEEEIIEVKGKNFTLRSLLQNPEYNQRALVIGIFLSKFDVHVSRVPLGGNVTYKKLEKIETSNRPMISEENDILKGIIDFNDMEYSFSNERYLETVIVNKYGYKYHLVTIADKEIDVVSHFKPSGTPMLQNSRLATIRWGSQICLVLPLPSPFDYELLVPNYYHVTGGIDELVKIKPKIPHVEIPVEKNKQELLLKAFNELHGFIKKEKDVQRKS